MTATFYVGDAITVMNTLPEKSVDLILTSPPFLALRSYLPQDHPDKALEGGSQATPGAYIDWLIDVIEACERLLAPHGSMVFELGDTYSGSGGAGGDYNNNGFRDGQPKFIGSAKRKSKNRDKWPLAKSLACIPELLRISIVYGFNPLTDREVGQWRLRNVIRWVRPNPPVGALGDKFRPATSELMVFCKAKDRFFDLDAVREPHSVANAGPLRSRAEGSRGSRNLGGDTGTTWDVGERMVLNPGGAPPLDWWNIPPGGYPGAHYAVWPPELLVKPIKAMCPEKVCRRCGEPQRRLVASERLITSPPRESNGARITGGIFGQGGKTQYNTVGFSDCEHHQLCSTCDGNGHYVVASTRGQYETDDIECPSCHGAGSLSDYRPGLVLDPFAGSGTTLSVATGHGRDAIGIDLDERNYELSLDRVGPLILQRGTARRINS